MPILGLVESFKTMNRLRSTVTLYDGLVIGKYKITYKKPSAEKATPLSALDTKKK